jgi:hypothetical protein
LLPGFGVVPILVVVVVEVVVVVTVVVAVVASGQSPFDSTAAGSGEKKLANGFQPCINPDLVLSALLSCEKPG